MQLQPGHAHTPSAIQLRFCRLQAMALWIRVPITNITKWKSKDIPFLRTSMRNRIKSSGLMHASCTSMGEAWRAGVGGGYGRKQRAFEAAKQLVVLSIR